LAYTGILYIGQDTQKYQVKAGDILVLMPEHRHWGYEYTTEDDEVSFYWFHFYCNDDYKLIDEKDFLTDISLYKNNPYFQGLENNAYIPIFSHINDTSKINILCRQILDSSNTEYYTTKIIDYILTTLVFEISHQSIDNFSKQRTSTTDDLVFANMLGWIKINLSNNISLQDVAAKFNFNKNYLAKLFKQRMGVTLNEYINTLRMTKAKELLTQSELSIKEIAYSVGFEDEKYFMRLFKRSEMVTAKQYRNTYCHTFINNF
jgi:YesN/AraC family two-component response regulator